MTETLVAACNDCGSPYGDEHGFPDLVVPNEVFRQISPSGDENGLFCPSCLCKRLYDRGIETTGMFTSGPLSPHVAAGGDMINAYLDAMWRTRMAQGGKAMVWPQWRAITAQLVKEATAEATAAYKVRVRAQAVRHGAVPKCRLCGGEWLWADDEHHVPVDAQPCAAEVEP